MLTLESFLPVILAVWATFALAATIARELNERRDKVLDVKSGLAQAHRQLIYRNDWRGFLSAYFGYQLLMLVLLCILAWRLWTSSSDTLLVIMCAILPFAALLRLVVTMRAFWLVDRPAIEDALNSLAQNQAIQDTE